MFTRTIKNRLAAAAVLAVSALGLTQKTEAAAVVYSANMATTSSTVYDPAGNRGLNQLGFLGGSSTVFTAANFLNFNDGSITTYKASVGYQTYTWNQQMGRDTTSTANIYLVNPDRSKDATPYNPGDLTGSLSQVFGPFTDPNPLVAPYKNMGYILDGEEVVDGHEDQTFNLLFPKGMVLNADNNSKTIELAWLERGGNSDIHVQGILGFAGPDQTNPILTDTILLSRTKLKKVGWAITSREIPAPQEVHGLGVSLDPSWQNLIGFKFTGFEGANGPDTVAVGTAFLTPSNATPVPLPAAFPAGLTLLGIIAVARRFS